MAIRVGWARYKGWDIDTTFLELLLAEPENLATFYSDTSASFTNCPAVKQSLRNTWLIRAPVSIKYGFDVDSNLAWSDQTRQYEERMIDPRYGQWAEGNRPFATFNWRYLFFADQPVWMETFPPFLHESPRNARYIPGGYDIYNWHRPVDYSFEFKDPRAEVVIKQGDPLFYIRFRSPDLRAKFTLEEVEWSDKLSEATRRCSLPMFVPHQAWQLIQRGNKLRPKRFLPRRIFKWLNQK